MNDSTQYRQHSNRHRINLSQDHEIRYWTEKFGCSAEELCKAVVRVGNSSEAVEETLKTKTHH